MKKIVRLTESELNRIVERSVRRAINEGAINESWKDIRNTVGAGALGAAALATDFGAGGPISTGVERQAAQQAKVSQADPATKNEFGKELKGKKLSDKKTASWPGTNNADSTKTSKGNVSDSRIRRAVMESLAGLMKECDGNSDKLADRNKAFNRLSHLDINTKDEDDNKEALRMRKHYIKGQRKS